jgi:hypothetical protein
VNGPLLALAMLVAEPPRDLDVRDPDGKVLISASQIATYDVATHTMSLKAGTRKGVYDAVFGKRGAREFVVAVGGEEVYRGTWKSVVESSSKTGPVIVIDRQSLDPKLPEDELRIDNGYPPGYLHRGPDRREAEAIREAVRNKHPGLTLPTNAGARALTGRAADEYRAAARWMEARLKEAEAIKPGSTYADVIKTFRTDGGISRLTVHRFVSILCPYLKIDVEFEGDAKKPLAKDAKVKKVSKPYFEREFGD